MIDYGRKISFSYQGRVVGASNPFDVCSPDDPFEVVLGEGRVFPVLEQALRGMEVGETKEVFIPCDEAYGKVDEKAVREIPLNSMPNYEQLVEGETILINSDRADQPGRALVKSISNGRLTLDFNHPLAGQDLSYEITLQSVSD